jgi:tetratricopeptide (TPR) repeat protein
MKVKGWTTSPAFGICAGGSLKFFVSVMKSQLTERRTSAYVCRAIFRELSRIVVIALSVHAWAQSDALSAQFTQATQAMQQGNLDAAASGFAAIVKQSPNFAEAHFNLGLVNEEQGKYDEAIASFQKALELKPHLRGANLFLGITEFRLNHLDRAHTAVAKETAGNPKDASAWMWLGVVCLAQDKPEEAADALDNAYKLKPDDEDILYHRGRAHLLVSKNSYARMFKVDPGSWRVRRVLAQADSEADRHLEAIAEYEAAIKLAPTQPGLHEELGSEYRNANKIPEAEEAFRRELEIDPNNVLARYKLGAIAIEHGDGATGKELIEAALRKKPGLIHGDYNLGRAHMLLGEDAAAAELLKRAATTDTDPEVVEQAWYQLGTVYRRLHRMDEARNAMETFQKLKDEGAKRSQQSLENYRKTHPQVPEPSPAPESTPAPQNPQ